MSRRVNTRRKKKRVVGRVIGCVYGLRSWASVGKQSSQGHHLANRSVRQNVTRKTAADACLRACLHAHPRRQTTLNCLAAPPDEPTTRLLAWEIAVVDSLFIRRPLSCLFTTEITPPEQSTSLHTPHLVRVVAGHTQPSIAHHNKQSHKQK